ncbi:chromatin assembly-1 protein [Apiospora kogelbergensis]|uniref:chromatin assembly-1 protein n=1 Tax=Apiospora kogelbergensis TaxID=1337665 RepID=UPI00312E4A00
MPLFDMSPNIQETEAASRKRSHDEYAEGAVKMDVDASVTPRKEPVISASVDEADLPASTELPNTALSSPLSSPPTSSSPPANTDGGSNTSPHNSPSPKQNPTPAAMAPSTLGANKAASSSTAKASAATSAPAKKKRTPAEVQADRVREEQERAAKRQRKEEEKAEKDKLKEEEKAEKEKARLAREAAKKEKEAEKEAQRKKKQDEEDKKKAEEEKKRRQQPTLSMMFGKKPKAEGPSTPVKQSIVKPEPSPAAQSSPVVAKSKPQKIPYERMFQPFFVKSGMTLAQPSFAQMTSETVTTKSKILDEYVYGQRSAENVKPFDAVRTFALSGLSSERGIIHPSVKKIMAELLGDPIESSDRTETQQARFSEVQKQLNRIPVKLVSFYEDVRPAYVGTVTSFSPGELRKLARRPTRRGLVKVNYEYDSEAEWEEEEGEDLDDVDDDEEGDEGDDEMADFLDDADDAVAVRTSHLPEEEPKSTGICFENRQRAGPCPTVYKFRMEFLLDSLPHHHSIDPFATDYWEQPKSTKVEALPSTVAVRSSPFDKNSGAAAAAAAGKAMPPPPNPSAVDPKDMVPPAEMDSFKRAIISDDISMLTKVSMIDMLSKRFKSCTKAQVRATLEIVAHRAPRSGGKKSERYWQLLPEHAL